jgi:hypothetical protein
MNVEDIQKFLDSKTSSQNEYVQIHFKQREPIIGLFLRGHMDYEDLKKKNFWRIVPKSGLAAYRRSGDIQGARIFCGADFSRLTLAEDVIG